MGTSAWKAIRSRWAKILGRGDDERANVFEGRLDETAASIAPPDDPRRAESEQEAAAEWRGALRALLNENPELVEAVRAEVAELDDEQSNVNGGELASVRQSAAVNGGISIQSGRDTSLR